MPSHKNSTPEIELMIQAWQVLLVLNVKTSLKAGHNNVGERRIPPSNMFFEFKNIMKMLKRFLKIAALENKVKI